MSEYRRQDVRRAREINGDPAALGIDRAVGEMRRGRAIHIAGRSTSGAPAGLVTAAAETAQAPLVRRLEFTGRRLIVLLTEERAHSIGIAGNARGPVAVALPPGAQIEYLRALAGASPGQPDLRLASVEHAPRCGPLAAAGFKLAKAGRLLPALVAIESDAPPDASLLSLDVDDIESQARFARHSLKQIGQSRVPLADAVHCELALFRDEHRLGEHVAVIIGEPNLAEPVPVRLHSACLTGDLLGSLRCDCGEQLRTAVRRIAELGGGVLLYLDQEGRGIGLANKLRAYALQDDGLDTIDADRHLGFLADERNYDVAAAVLQALGVSRVRLLTNNPQKIAALAAHGIHVAGRLPLVGRTNSHNERYLRAKRERAGHLADESEA
ncbi:MAG TPA: GTP cyclohydrolase II [Gammaproteobacteria bacterium]